MKPVVFGTLLFLAVSSYAQTLVQESRIVKMDAICGTEKQITKVLDHFEEKPMLAMLSERDGGRQQQMAVLFVNPKTRTYTLVEELPNDIYCVVSMGKGLMPYTEQPEEKKTPGKKF